MIDGGIVGDGVMKELIMVVKNEKWLGGEKNLRIRGRRGIEDGFGSRVCGWIRGNYWCEGGGGVFVDDGVYVYFDK